MNIPVVIYFDAAVEPRNPGGYGCWAFVALDRDGNEVVADYGNIGSGPDVTNNRMEYIALSKALAWVKQHRLRGLVVRGDSQLVINQVKGEWACNSPNLIPLCREMRALAQELDVRLQWVPREKNVRADGYSRKAYREAQRAR